MATAPPESTPFLNDTSIYNYLKIKDATLQGLIDEINTESDVNARIEKIKETAKYEADQCYISWIMNPKNIVAYNEAQLADVDSAEFYIVTKDIKAK